MSASRGDLSELTDADLAGLLRPVRTGRPGDTDGGMSDTGARALDELYRRHRRAVLANARLYVGAEQADDLTSETFLRTVRAVRRGSGPSGSWRPYLLTAVRHAATELARGRRRLVPMSAVEDWATSVPDRADPERELLRGEEAHLLARSFGSLPKRWRDVLWYRLVEDRPAPEVARLLDTSQEAVSALFRRAREGLRAAYLQSHVRDSGDAECTYYASALGALVRNRGRPGVRLARHLQGCDRCSKALADLKNLNTSIKAFVPVPLVSGGGAKSSQAGWLTTNSWIAGTVVGAAIAMAVTWSQIPADPPARETSAPLPAPATVPVAEAASEIDR